MSNPIFYLQECPTCGRNLRIRVVYLGKTVYCQHCGADFLARDPVSGVFTTDGTGVSVMQRADQLLESVETMKQRPG